MTLVMTVGGASGPLYGTLFMTLGKELAGRRRSRRRRARRSARRSTAVKARGKSEVGQKTMLDVLVPVHEAAARAAMRRRRCAAVADERPQATVPMKATRGRASFLGDRSIGHMDPGARSSRAHRSRAVADVAGGAERMSGNVGIVIVSHSPMVAEGAADMVRQMVGDEVPLAWCGGNPDGGLGTSVEAIMAAIDAGLVGGGVAILVDLGGAETNSEMAIEMLDEDRAGRVVDLQRADRRGRRHGGDRGVGRRRRSTTVRATAEELSPQ